MAVKTEYISVSSQGRRDCIDLTGHVVSIIEKSGVTEGLVTVFASGSTAAVTTLEFEPGLRKDIDLFLERIIPYKEKYYHHDTWHDDNGSSHLQAAMIGPSISVPFTNGAMTLGTWQQIVLIDCDTRPRNRKIVVQIIY